MKFTEEELTAFRAEYAKGSTDSQFSTFISECEARSLRPGVHLVFQLRRSKEYDSTTGAHIWVSKGYWITTIAALRLIAQRTGEYLGQGVEEYVYLDSEGNPTIKSDIPLPDPSNRSLPREPWVARAKVYRKGFTEPMIGTARFEAYAATRTIDNKLVLTDMWAKRGSEQLLKCAEALALRKSYPEEMSGLMLAEEIRDEEKPSPEPTPTAIVLPEAPSVPKVDQTPAVPTNNPRPGELSKKQIEDAAKEMEKVSVKPNAEGDYIGFDQGGPPNVSPDPAVSAPVETTQVVVTSGGADLPTKTEVVETPLPEPKKRGRKPKPGPENGRPDLGTPNWESAEEMEAIAATPAIEKTEANKVEAQEFVEAVTSFTNEQAAAQELPPPEDPLPDPRAFDEFVKRMRACTGPKIDIQTLGAYSFKFTEKTKAKFFTVGDWTRLLDKIEGAKFDDKLAELVKQ